MNRTIVVTGTASGIGSATQTLLESGGDRVIGVDLHDAEVTVDLATSEGRASLAPAVRERSGGTIDAVVACAGVMTQTPLTVQVNFFGAVATLEELRPLLAGSDAPRAVAISSMSILHSNRDDPIVQACLAGDESAAVAAAEGKGLGIYPASKRALAAWIRREAPTPRWAGAGIPLNAIAPGVVITPMTEPDLANDDMRALFEASVPMPLNGFSQPEQIAPLLQWLVGEANTLTTGQVIFIDGGSDVVLRGDDVW